MFSKLDESVFANVDLDIYSSADLRPLVDAFGRKVIEIWVGKVRRTYEAHLELGWTKKQNPTSIIVRFCRLIESLKPDNRQLWDAAKTKSFDIGIHAPTRNHHYWSAVSREAVRAAADVGAQIAFTIYGPMTLTKSAKRKRRSN
jgi:hypothetical protein